MKTTGAPPDLRSEINRKSMDAMSWLINGLDKALISEAEFSGGVDALFMALNGLADRDFFELVTAASEQIDGKRPVEKRVLYSGAIMEIVTISYEVGDVEFQMVKRDLMEGTEKVAIREFESPIRMKEAVEKLVSSMKKLGFKEA